MYEFPNESIKDLGRLRLSIKDLGNYEITRKCLKCLDLMASTQSTTQKPTLGTFGEILQKINCKLFYSI